jgi:hypothetical protein
MSELGSESICYELNCVPPSFLCSTSKQIEILTYMPLVSNFHFFFLLGSTEFELKASSI